MLTDTKLKALKPKDKLYKVSDRDGLYVVVLTSGTVSFRYYYRINDRRETLAIGRYGQITLSEARGKLFEAKRLIAEGMSPSIEKQKKKELGKTSHFGDWLGRWLKEVNYKDSTRNIVDGIIRRDVEPKFGKKALNEITADMLRVHCEKIKDRGASASAVKTRDIIGNVFTYAKARGVNCDNPADYVAPSTIATFTPRDRALSKREIGIFFGQSQHGTVSLSSLNRAATHTIQLAQKKGLPLSEFVLHDMRRTASTHLHEAGYHSDWIEKALAHEQRGVRRFTIRLSMQNSAASCCRIGRIWLMGGLGNIRINNGK